MARIVPIVLCSIAIAMVESLRLPKSNGVRTTHVNPFTAISSRDRNPKTARDIAASTLVDRYEKSSIFTENQEAGILDLARLLNEPTLLKIADNLLIASRKFCAEPKFSYSPPDKIFDPPNNEGIIPNQTLDIIDDGSEAEISLSSVIDKVLSLSKRLLKAATILAGIPSQLVSFISASLTREINKVSTDHKISRCSRLALSRTIRATDKFERLIESNRCSVKANLAHSLENLDASLNLLQCYIRANAQEKDQESVDQFTEQMKDILKFVNAMQLKSQDCYNQGCAEQLSDLHTKLLDITTSKLVMRMSDRDISLHIFNTAQQRLLKDTIEAVQIQHADKLIEQKKVNQELCKFVLESSKMLIAEVRAIGTTMVDRLIGTAKSITQSFDDLATKANLGVVTLSSYKEIYDSIVLASKGFQSGDYLGISEDTKPPNIDHPERYH